MCQLHKRSLSWSNRRVQWLIILAMLLIALWAALSGVHICMDEVNLAVQVWMVLSQNLISGLLSLRWTLFKVG